MLNITAALEQIFSDPFLSFQAGIYTGMLIGLIVAIAIFTQGEDDEN